MQILVPATSSLKPPYQMTQIGGWLIYPNYGRQSRASLAETVSRSTFTNDYFQQHVSQTRNWASMNWDREYLAMTVIMPPLRMRIEAPGVVVHVCIYVFEKTLALECGHVSTIWDRELSGVSLALTNSDSPLSIHETYRFAAISLANVLRELQERSARTWHREEWLPQTVEEVI